MSRRWLVTAGFLWGICVVATPASAVEPPVTALVFAADGQTVVAGSQSGVSLYDWPALTLRRTLTTAAVNVHDLAFSADGLRLAVGGGAPSENGVVEILSWPQGKSLQMLGGHDDSVMAVAWNEDSLLASASLDHAVIIFDATTGSPQRRLAGHSRGVTGVCFSADGRVLVTAGHDQSLRVWDAKSGELSRSLVIHTHPIHHLALRPGEHALPLVATVSRDRTVRLWQPTIGRMVRFARLPAEPLDVDWLPDGSRVVVSCADGSVRAINPDTVEVTATLPALDGVAFTLAVHPTDGTLAVGGTDGLLRRVALTSE